MQRLFSISFLTLIFFMTAVFSTPAEAGGPYIDACREAILANPGNASAHVNLGVAYAGVGQHREAIESYKHAIVLKPESTAAHFNLGVAYYDLGDYREAIESYRRAVFIEPHDADALRNLALAYAEYGDLPSAWKEYKKLKKLDKDEAKTLKKLLKSYEKAEKEAEKARKDAQKDADKAEREAVKNARKGEKDRLKRKAKILGISVREVREQEFWEEFWEKYRLADPDTRVVMKYQMEVYMRKREVEAEEEIARAARDAAAACWMNSYWPYCYDPWYWRY